MKRIIALIAALACATANAYLGSFDPQPLRHEVRVTFVDSQLPGPQCVAEEPSIEAPLVAMVQQAFGWTDAEVDALFAEADAV